MSIEISVIIPVYNAETYVSRAVKSALQFPEVKEILLIEDGSPDNALEVCRQLAGQHDRIRLLQHPDKGNHGAGASRNLGLANASCPYIAFLDADDFYLSNRFEADKRIFHESPDVDGVYNALGVHFYSQDASDRYKSASMQELTTVTEYVDSNKLFESFIFIGKGYGYFHIDGITIKKEALQKMDYWFNPALSLHQDTEFFIRLTYTARLMPGEIKIPTVNRGVHLENRIVNMQFDNERKMLHQKALWDSLYNWAKTENIPERYLKQIYRINIIKTLPTYKFAGRWSFFLRRAAKDVRLLIDPSYYNMIHYVLFGDNKPARLLLRLKNSMHHVWVSRRSLGRKKSIRE